MLVGVSESPTPAPPVPAPPPGELRALPPEERDAILAGQAATAEDLYRSDPELTAFDAFGEEPVDGDTESSEAR